MESATYKASVLLRVTMEDQEVSVTLNLLPLKWQRKLSVNLMAKI